MIKLYYPDNLAKLAQIGGKAKSLEELVGFVAWLKEAHSFSFNTAVPGYFVISPNFPVKKEKSVILSAATQLGARKFIVRSSAKEEHPKSTAYDGQFETDEGIDLENLIRSILHIQSQFGMKIPAIVQVYVGGFMLKSYTAFPSSSGDVIKHVWYEPQFHIDYYAQESSIARLLPNNLFGAVKEEVRQEIAKVSLLANQYFKKPQLLEERFDAVSNTLYLLQRRDFIAAIGNILTPSLDQSRLILTGHDANMVGCYEGPCFVFSSSGINGHLNSDSKAESIHHLLRGADEFYQSGYCLVIDYTCLPALVNSHMSDYSFTATNMLARLSINPNLKATLHLPEIDSRRGILSVSVTGITNEKIGLSNGDRIIIDSQGTSFQIYRT